jgi:tetratricopeptide (TPR) repeat protein
MFRRLVLPILFLASFLVSEAQAISPEQLSRRLHELPRKLKETTIDSTRAKVLLELALSYVYKPGEYASDLDSAILLTVEAEKINGQLHSKKTEAMAHFVYAVAFREKGNPAAGKIHIESSLKIYKSIFDPENMAEAFAEKSRYYSINESTAEIKEMRKCLEEALVLFRISGSKGRQADVLKDLGDLDQILGNAELAMRELNEALSIYKSMRHESLQGIYDLMGYICAKKGDYTDAVRFGLLAVKTGEEVKDTTIQMCTIYLRLALSYAFLSNFDQSLSYAGDAMAIATKYKDRSSILICMEFRCLAFSRSGKEAASLESIRQGEAIIPKPWSRYDSIHLNLFYVITYVNAEKYEKARPYIVEMERQLKTIKKDILTYSTFHFMVTYYMKTHQSDKAETTMADYFSVLVPNNGKRHLARAYQLKSQLDSAKGGFQVFAAEPQIVQRLNRFDAK